MTKILRITAALIVLAAPAATAGIESNRTFMRARDIINNSMLMSLSGQAYTTTEQKEKRNEVGCTVSLASFYRTSYNATDIARNFGGGQSVNNDQNGRLLIEPGQSSTMEQEAHNLYSGTIDHFGSDNSNLAGMYGSLNFSPSRSESGTYLTVRQKVPFIMKDLTFFAEIPFAYVKHNLGTSFSGKAHTADSFGEAGTTLQTYFSGKKLAKINYAAQDALLLSRIDGLAHTTTGVADVLLGAHYVVYKKHASRASMSGYISFPTGNIPTGLYLFEPTVGSRHTSLGLRAHGAHCLFKSEGGSTRLNLIGALDYRYSFEATELRTLGLFNHWYNTIATGSQYRNIALAGSISATPAANILTRATLVKPGQTLNAAIGLRGVYNDLRAGLFYNLYVSEGEKVTLAPEARWFDGEYGMFGHGGDVSGGITVGANTDTEADPAVCGTYGGAIQQEGNSAAITKDSALHDVGSNNAAQYYITTAACSGRPDITHKFGLSGEWLYRKTRFPVSVSAGAEYEIAGSPVDNSGIHSAAVWAKCSICF